MAWPADKRFMTVEQFKAHVDALDFSKWRPIGIVWHNTAEPTLKRWHEVPRERWMVNLESYYKGQGWNGGPHLFIDDQADGIGLFNPLNARGTHSPSFNAQWIGIEHVGDYAREDDDSGAGLRVKMNGIAATAILCARLGIDPATHIKLHKEDPRTDHDCPGRDMAEDKAAMIQSVIEYMGEGGDHGPAWAHVADPPVSRPGPTPEPPEPVVTLVTTTDDLNLRSGSSQGARSLAKLNRGTDLAEIGAPVMNGSTRWLRVRDVEGKREGWVAAKYTKAKKEVVSNQPDQQHPGPHNEEPPSAPVEPAEAVVFRAEGKMSTFGGPADEGMSEIEGLAIFETMKEAEAHGAADFFMGADEAGAIGLGRRLHVEKLYVACRWNYQETLRAFLQDAVAHVSANGKTVLMRPMDWGPNVNTGRAADLSPGGAEALGLSTDDTCEVVIYASGK